jgi:hypothetical protein
MGIKENIQERMGLGKLLRNSGSVRVFFRDEWGKPTEMKIEPGERITAGKIIKEGRKIEGCDAIDVAGNNHEGYADTIKLRVCFKK